MWRRSEAKLLACAGLSGERSLRTCLVGRLDPRVVLLLDVPMDIPHLQFGMHVLRPTRYATGSIFNIHRRPENQLQN
jgi:hypothetical protein